MNYEEKSDFEINKAVALTYLQHKYPLAKSIEYDNSQRCFWVESTGFSSYLIPDYCNNPNDAWPIILENNISLINDDQGNVGAVIKENKQIWLPKSQALRATMITFLMMKEAN